jgi:phosphosulfolactate synthase (CoM biosynthesis protein A)
MTEMCNKKLHLNKLTDSIDIRACESFIESVELSWSTADLHSSDMHNRIQTYEWKSNYLHLSDYKYYWHVGSDTTV